MQQCLLYALSRSSKCQFMLPCKHIHTYISAMSLHVENPMDQRRPGNASSFQLESNLTFKHYARCKQTTHWAVCSSNCLWTGAIYNSRAQREREYISSLAAVSANDPGTCRVNFLEPRHETSGWKHQERFTERMETFLKFTVVVRVYYGSISASPKNIS